MKPWKQVNKAGSGLGILLAALVLLLAPGGLFASGEGLTSLDGASAASSLSSGTQVLVVFASWSPRCRGVVATSNDLVQALGGRAQVSLVAFQEEASAVRSFVGNQAKAGLLLDPNGDFAKRHAVSALPGLVVLEGGTVKYAGPLPADTAATLKAAGLSP